MSNLDFILAKKEDKKEAVPTLHLWSPDTGLKEAFWQAPRFNHETDEPVLAEHLAYDPPTVALNHWHDIYVGTFSGAIHKIPAALNKIPKEELEKLNLKESLTKKNRFADIRTYEDRQLIDERHYLLQGS